MRILNPRVISRAKRLGCPQPDNTELFAVLPGQVASLMHIHPLCLGQADTTTARRSPNTFRKMRIGFVHSGKKGENINDLHAKNSQFQNPVKVKRNTNGDRAHLLTYTFKISAVYR